MQQNTSTENKLFTTLMGTFLFFMLASFTTKDAHTQNVREQAQAVQVSAPSIQELEPNMPVVYVVGKRLPRNAS